jgi:hypothetical protein
MLFKKASRGITLNTSTHGVRKMHSQNEEQLQNAKTTASVVKNADFLKYIRFF